FTAEPAVAGVDLARFQCATQGAGQSTGRGGHHVVQRGGVVRELPRGRAVVLADLVVGPEEDGLRLDRQVGAPDRASLADDPDLRHVERLVHTPGTSSLRAVIPIRPSLSSPTGP